MHLTQLADDRQVVTYLARRFEERGLVPILFHPTQLRPDLCVATARGPQALDGLYRFVPGDWLEQLPSLTGWKTLFSSSRVSNPLSTLLVQSKRFPLVWSQLKAPLTTWKKLLPETRELTDGRGPEWVIKPSFGNEGTNVVMDDGSRAAIAARLRTRARRDQLGWVAQRRFESAQLVTPDGPRHVCIGVFVVDGRRAGFYARLSESPVIDAGAQEAVVL
jgi:hypothetical protein